MSKYGDRYRETGWNDTMMIGEIKSKPYAAENKYFQSVALSALSALQPHLFSKDRFEPRQVLFGDDVTSNKTKEVTPVDKESETEEKNAKKKNTVKRLKNGLHQVREEELKNPRGFIEDGMWGGGYALVGLTPLMSVAWPVIPMAMGISFSVRSASSFLEGVTRDPDKTYTDWRHEKNRKIKRLSVKSILLSKKKTPLSKKIKLANRQVIENELKNPHRYLEDGFWAGFAGVSGAAGKGAFFWPAIPIAAGLSFFIRHTAEFVTDVLQKDPSTGESPEKVGKDAEKNGDSDKPWQVFDADGSETDS